MHIVVGMSDNGHGGQTSIANLDMVDGMLAKPPHIQRLEQALNLDYLTKHVEKILREAESNSDSEEEDGIPSDEEVEGTKLVNGIIVSRAERRIDKARLFNFSKVKKSRKWLKNALMSDSESSEDEISETDLREMLKMHEHQRKHKQLFSDNKELHQYQYYGAGLLSNQDKWYEHQRLVLGPKKKQLVKAQREKRLKAKLKKIKAQEKKLAQLRQFVAESSDHEPEPASIGRKRPYRKRPMTPAEATMKRRKIWSLICKKEISKVQKQKHSAKKENLQVAKRLAVGCLRERRKTALLSQKTARETASRMRRLTREMLLYWKRFEKVEKEHRKRAEKEALEQLKMNSELLEARRQQRKLNFLITQTELYAHFMSRKLSDVDSETQQILGRLDERPAIHSVNIGGATLNMGINDEDYKSDTVKQDALKNVKQAYETADAKRKGFDDEVSSLKQQNSVTETFSLSNPSIVGEEDRQQPKMFRGTLKCYQLKGMNWLANLYDQGINGILADEMGLGKTVQTIAVLSHLCEAHSIWGPFLIIAPASTLHNWTQEFSRFVPKMKVLPYWGNTSDRRILRKFWNQKKLNLHTEDASFHVLITSYQLIVQDVKYFQRIKWQYMVLDEAQAIKSSASIRWNILLAFTCRNRLLLTGTPIQNSMAELWALLHFIMPTLFDSHDEFNEWFSKDIESHAEKQTGIDEKHLSRLHMILKPFMLRRIKKEVENELSEKIEILKSCHLTNRQKDLYIALKNKISIEDLLQTTNSNPSQVQSSTSSLMNIVMQFRKVCNHPELFERREVKSPLYMEAPSYQIPLLIYRQGLTTPGALKTTHLLKGKLSLFSPDNIHRSIFPAEGERGSSCFSFLRFVDTSPSELSSIMLGGVLVRWLAVVKCLIQAHLLCHRRNWSEGKPRIRYLDRCAFLLAPSRVTYFSTLQSSHHMSHLVFTSPTSTLYTHVDATETLPLEWRNSLSRQPGGITKGLATKRYRAYDCQPAFLPPYMVHVIPKVSTSTRLWYCPDRSAAWQVREKTLGGSAEARQVTMYGSPQLVPVKEHFSAQAQGGLLACACVNGWSHIQIPDKETLVTDAGKLYALDQLLRELKADGHRVLIYSQMTRMIDLLEEYMWHRKHTYIRLDGSSKISDRRDMVADFQSRSDIFVFLLSTRAGGLGINLTAADTVIFYDSDWNPTVDQQAMDRAHRLGQTKQVVVYRLICKDTIEERILQRAREKSEIQRMVISGGQFKPDTLKPKEVVSLILDDGELEKKMSQKQDHKRLLEEKNKEKDRKRKRDQYVSSKSNSPAEPGKPVKRGPGRPRKVVKPPDPPPRVPDHDAASVASLESPPASPLSEISSLAIFGEESSDIMLNVEENWDLLAPVEPTPPPPKKKKRGRPKGSGKRVRGTVATLSAAEQAGVQAGMSAAISAIGLSMQARGAATPPSRSSSFSSLSSLPNSASHFTRSRSSPGRGSSASAKGTPGTSPRHKRT
ncbi:PREDICTED: DNA helicase INO80-like isoform X2 [Priapulus caudatus]|uniref:Chromatin-remodeling ATPase INO80 n=1 Tax=Priapulus caudatus TaxID=37621 RepID=A0ABM1EJM0_PRICU|nr:PREDICTED: DNA helicase INO80-like isoform X2 [Priapulus caudatus]